MGLSSRPGGHYGFTLKERLDDFGQWAESLDLTEPAHLIVHDWGGPIGLGWASQNPGRVASLTVMNTGLRVPKGFKVPLKLAIFRLSPFLGRLMATELNIFVKGVTRHGTVRPLAPEAIEGFLAPYGLPSHREGIYGFVDDIPLKGKGCSETLAGIDQGFGLLADKPTLFVWGLRDFVFTKHFLDDFTQRLPQAQVIPLPRAGHWLLEDEPLAIAKAIKAFLPRR
jgi:haloalkane dehalogenase